MFVFVKLSFLYVLCFIFILFVYFMSKKKQKEIKKSKLQISFIKSLDKGRQLLYGVTRS